MLKVPGFYLFFFSPPTLLTWLLFSWLTLFIPQLQFILCSTTSFNLLFFFSFTLLLCLFFFYTLCYLAFAEGTEAQCSLCLQTIVASASKPKHPADQWFSSPMSVHGVHLWLLAGAVKYKLQASRSLSFNAVLIIYFLWFYLFTQSNTTLKIATF